MESDPLVCSKRPPLWACKYLCATVHDRTERSVEAVALRLVGIIATLFILLIVPVIALVLFGFLWAKWLALVVVVIVLAALAALWRGGVMLLRASPDRDGSIHILKLVCFVFLGIVFWLAISKGPFNMDAAGFGVTLAEVIFLLLAMVYLSLALASRTRIPLSAWIAIGCSLLGIVPVAWSALKEFGLL